MRVKLLSNTKFGNKNQVVEVTKNEAFGLIDSGKAIVSKDMTPDDYKQAGDKNGITTQLRSNNRSRR